MPGIRDQLRGRWGRPRVVVAAAVVVGLGWWWWPAVTGRGNGTDVVVIGDGDLLDAQVPVARRLRELGLSVEVATPPRNRCAALGSVDGIVRATSPRTVVIGLRDLGACAGEPVSAALAQLRRDGVDVVVVTQPGSAEVATGPAATAAGVVVADPSPFLGAGPLPRRAACQWWDVECPGGDIEVRDAAGRLTEAGAQRLARVVAAELR